MDFLIFLDSWWNWSINLSRSTRNILYTSSCNLLSALSRLNHNVNIIKNQPIINLFHFFTINSPVQLSYILNFISLISKIFPINYLQSSFASTFIPYRTHSSLHSNDLFFLVLTYFIKFIHIPYRYLWNESRAHHTREEFSYVHIYID